MSDNLAVSQGSGTTLRTTDTGTAHIQHVLAGEKQRVYDGIQNLTLTSSSQALTVPGGATHALVYCEGAAGTDFARYWQDGTAPTASVGKKLKDHEEIELASPSNFHAIIGSGGGSPVLRIEYYHYA